MNYETVQAYLIAKPEAIEDYPFGPDTAVFKVKHKLFATLGEENNIPCINLKCDPDEAVMLRDVFDAVIPGYHMNKRHWNTVILDGSIPNGEIERMIDNSYGLVVKGLMSAERKQLELQYTEKELYG